ncbi:MAG: hypothetical protein HYY17_07905 [Planctomycetes bacterium]|nr:hypothetical protein [Planctomycetota bacterium]
MQLQAEGFECGVIGGCAVGAYGRLQGESVLSGDLDLYSSAETLNALLLWAPQHGLIVRKRPQPRSIPTAFIEWEGLEVNVLTRTDGLPPPEQALQTAREFRLKSQPDVAILVIDPFDLLRNKLAVNRPKDRPHIAILRRFIEEEVVAGFENGSSPRDRIAPARRFLSVLDARALPAELAARLIPLAKTPAEFRFLVDTVPSRDDVEAVLERTPEETREELREILKRRRFRKS